MKTKYSFIDKLKKNNYKYIDIYNFNYFTASEKESKVFQESVKFSKTRKTKYETYQNCLEYPFYNFQLLVELLDRFHREMWISDENLNYILYAFEDLKLAYRFLYLWYYTTSWFHLRWFFEKNIYWIYYHLVESNKMEALEYENDIWLIAKECLKIGELSCKNTDLDDDTYNEYYFPTWEIKKLYKYYSMNYVHNTRPNTDLQFSAEEFKKLYFLIEITLIYVPRFFKVTIWKLMEECWKNKILKPVEWYLYYYNYLSFLFWENKIISNQYSTIYNLIHDDKDNEKFIKELWIDEHNLFEKEYLKQVALSNRCRKKAKWDSKKYCELLLEYFEKTEKN